jgi:3-hydroxy-D-aspartate aldolase
VRRFAALAHDAHFGACADDPTQIRALDEAAGAAGITLPVYVEGNMAATAAASSRASRRSPSRGRSRKRRISPFGGLQAYHGSAQHLRGWEERRQAIAQAAPRPPLRRSRSHRLRQGRDWA